MVIMMKTTIPDFLLEMSKQINTQDNRCTGDPLWQVMCKRTRVTAEDYSDRLQILDRENEYHVVADSEDGDINQQIVDYLECDPEDLPVNLEQWVDKNCDYDHDLDGQSKIDFFLEEFDHDSDTLYDNFDKIWVEEYEQIIKTCLTEHDADHFMRNNAHNWPPMYTYVTSMYRCPQMIELRKWIMELTK